MPFITSKKWQTFRSSLLRPLQMSTKDHEIPSVTEGPLGRTMVHDFSFASIESRSLSLGTMRSCSWKKRSKRNG